MSRSDLPVPVCPACGSTWRVFSETRGVPANSCLLVQDRSAALALPQGDLLLAHCSDCGFVGNAGHRAGLTAYDGDYEETQGCSARFVTFATELARRWIDRYDLHQRDVLEVGCGKGEFLGLLAEHGANRCVGLDPAIDPGRAPVVTRGSVELRAERYEGRYTGPTPDAVVCRHTLEHIGPVGAFLRMLRADLPAGAVVLFEVPDGGRVLASGAVEDVYYEHCSYFTAGSLSRLFRRSGFQVVQVDRVFDDQYLLLEARPGVVDTSLGEEDLVDLAVTAAAVEHYAVSVRTTAELWSAELRGAASRGERSVLWGGGSKAVAFLTTLGLGDAVDAVVDINPVKQGRAMPGSGHPVVGPVDLVVDPPDLVVVMNAAYEDEVRQLLGRLGLTPRIRSL